MKKVVILCLSAVYALGLYAQTAREEIKANKYLSGSQYLDYDRRILPDKALTPAPKGYEPYYMSQYLPICEK